MALSDASRTITGLRSLITDVELAQTPITIFQDNMAATEWVNGGTERHLWRRNRFDIRHGYVLSIIDKGEIVLKHIPTTSMIAHFFNQAVGPQGLPIGSITLLNNR